MADQGDLPKVPRSAIEMSDDDFLNAGPQDYSEFDNYVEGGEEQPTPTESDDEAELAGEEDEGAQAPESDDGPESEGGEEDDLDDEDEPDTEDADDEGADDGDPDAESEDDEGDAPAGDEEGEPEGKKSDEEKEVEEDAAKLDEAALADFHKQLTTPFRAAGRDIKVTDPAEMQRLMQMGIDYDQKMRGMKPHLRLLRTLDKHKLLEGDKVGMLIDVFDKKDPKAIANLLSTANIDPMDLDLDSGKDYKPGNHEIPEKEYAVTETLESLQSTPTYSQLISSVKSMDTASRQTLNDHPAALVVLNNHIASGVFDQVNNEVVKVRALGGLAGLSDLDAYRKVAETLESQGALTPAESQAPKKASEQSPANERPPAKKAPKQTDEQDQRRREKRSRAASPKKRPPARKMDYNPLEESDEEFAKRHGM